MKRTRVAAAATLATVCLGALSGCGDLHPGAAAVVGDETISDQTLDDDSQALCEALKANPQGMQGAYTTEQLNRSVVQGLVLRSVGDQLASEYDVESGSAYAALVKQTNTQLASLDPALRESVVPLFTSGDYFSDMLDQVGTAALRQEGTDAPPQAQAAQQGLKIAQDWVDEHGIELDPRFPQISLTNQVVYTESQSSYPVSDFARDIAAQRPSPETVSALPASQRCG